MKQLQLAAILLLSTFFLKAQSSNNNPIPVGFSLGSIILPDNTISEGYLKNNLKKSGEVIFVSSDGKKTRYNASQVSGLTMGNDKYIAVNNTFYRLVKDGTKMRLLQKASNTAGIQYNGSEPIAVTAGEGTYDDYFIQPGTAGKLHLVRKKEFSKLFSSICADCKTLTDDVKANKIGFGEIEKAVDLYNACTN